MAPDPVGDRRPLRISASAPIRPRVPYPDIDFRLTDRVVNLLERRVDLRRNRVLLRGAADRIAVAARPAANFDQ
jgi:hypothetical protein